MSEMRRLAAITACAGTVLLSATGSSAAAGTPQATLKRALAAGVHAAGRSSSAYVLDLTTGQTLFSSRADTPRLPASVEKVYTTSTALLKFGPSVKLTTWVLGSGQFTSDGTFVGTLYLKGGGDPTFGSSSFDGAYYGT